MRISINYLPTRFRSTTSRSCALLFLLCSLPLLLQSAPVGTQSDAGQSLRGKVVFSDDAPAGGAKIEATAICEGFGLTQFTTTAEDGTFSFPLFHRKEHSDVDCKQYRLRASKPEDYWLPSDENIFSGFPPTVHTIDLPVGVDSPPIHIVLNIRGGKVSIRVWDVATSRFVRATLYLERKPVEGKKFGSVTSATGEEGSAAAELLPPGEYTVEVQSYPCHTEDYWTVGGPIESFVVEPGKQLDVIIKIDVRNIKPLSGPHGRRRGKCKP
jgi:hypothetical protein